ncbi:hypothetical protein, partial [uncultured Empedobacter sp.]|uniref:hypothetical protein n=1 Tax=uncultured Empedobacter sp. TaxID=410844 RepID=UPI0025E5A1FC
MKKFISLVALATLLISAVSCREAEQIADLQENPNLSAKVMNVSDQDQKLGRKIKKDKFEL